MTNITYELKLKQHILACICSPIYVFAVSRVQTTLVCFEVNWIYPQPSGLHTKQAMQSVYCVHNKSALVLRQMGRVSWK